MTGGRLLIEGVSDERATTKGGCQFWRAAANRVCQWRGQLLLSLSVLRQHITCYRGRLLIDGLLIEGGY